MKDSEIYLRAAERQSRLFGDAAFSCHTIQRVAGVLNKSGYDYQDHSATVRFYDVFLKDNSWSFSANDRWSSFEEKFNELKNVRVLALLFMHQIALDEEKLTRRTFNAVTKGKRK